MDTRRVAAACLLAIALAALAAAGPGPVAKPFVNAWSSDAPSTEPGLSPSAGPSETAGEEPSPGQATESPEASASPSASPTPADLMPLLRGVVLDLDGRPLDMSGGRLVLDELQGTGQPSWHTLVPVGKDGTFLVRIMPWGVQEAPARLALSFGPSDYVKPVVTSQNGTTCYRWSGLTGMLRLEVVLAGGAEPPAVEVRASRAVEEAICGAQGSPSPSSDGRAAPSGSSLATPPATSRAAGTPGEGGSGLGGLVALVLGSFAAVALLAGRRSRRS